ncbi:hypothetical protein BDV93DRAFT_77406 [Ceratobasidium sp. AG-I]|nr:hypothetical protein BDV93DRAFT_77406 [Ceratobasidium sp. AG-I]
MFRVGGQAQPGRPERRVKRGGATQPSTRLWAVVSGETIGQRRVQLTGGEGRIVGHGRSVQSGGDLS